MRRTRLYIILLASMLVLLLYAPPSLAVSPIKVWVSNAGADSAACGTVTSPCRTLQQGHDNVSRGGEIGILTPGEYASPSPLLINKSVSITNDGAGEASIKEPANSAGMIIDAGTGDIIAVRGLIIDGRGVSDFGIDIGLASAVHIQNCVIRDHEGRGGFGIFLSTQLTGASVQLFVSDTIIYNNGSDAASGGILVRPGMTGTLKVVLDRVHLENNVIGIFVDGGVSTGSGSRVTVRDSVISGNASHGIWSSRPAGGGSPSVVLVERTAVVGNAGAGVLADGGGIVQVSNSTVEYNGTGASVVNGGRLFTYQNNTIDNNVGEDLSPTAIVRATR